MLQTRKLQFQTPPPSLAHPSFPTMAEQIRHTAVPQFLSTTSSIPIDETIELDCFSDDFDCTWGLPETSIPSTSEDQLEWDFLSQYTARFDPAHHKTDIDEQDSCSCFSDADDDTQGDSPSLDISGFRQLVEDTWVVDYDSQLPFELHSLISYRAYRAYYDSVSSERPCDVYSHPVQASWLDKIGKVLRTDGRHELPTARITWNDGPPSQSRNQDPNEFVDLSSLRLSLARRLESGFLPEETDVPSSPPPAPFPGMRELRRHLQQVVDFSTLAQRFDLWLDWLVPVLARGTCTAVHKWTPSSPFGDQSILIARVQHPLKPTLFSLSDNGLRGSALLRSMRLLYPYCSRPRIVKKPQWNSLALIRMRLIIANPNRILETPPLEKLAYPASSDNSLRPFELVQIPLPRSHYLQVLKKCVKSELFNAGYRVRDRPLFLSCATCEPKDPPSADTGTRSV
jgi:hypothetical protein